MGLLAGRVFLATRIGHLLFLVLGVLGALCFTLRGIAYVFRRLWRLSGNFADFMDRKVLDRVCKENRDAARLVR
jgi:hypothetical protein